MTHVPVLLPEVMEALQVRSGGLYVDATFGRGGYSRAWLQRGARVIGFDRDPAAAVYAHELAAASSNFCFHAAPFSALAEHLAGKPVDGIAFDLGVSSPQLDEAARGFSFLRDGPLDMRMDTTSGPSAAELVNTLDEAELADILYTYGEERASRRIAKAIVQARAQQPLTRTLQLAEVIRAVMPRRPHESDPCTRSFQALRIAVNDELGELERGLAAALQVLAPQGRLAVVSFHSLEDRIVKNFLKPADNPSRHRPLAPVALAAFSLPRGQPITPSSAECAANPRARSAKLRYAIKQGEAA